MRLKLTLEYDGTSFVGWQSQPNGPSVQGALEAALARFTGETPRVFGAGRTDSGVHATGQVAHVDLARDWVPEQVQGALNYYLKPAPVGVLAAEAVPDDFHARFSATGRRYRFHILNRRAPPALAKGRVWWVSQPLDAPAMAEAAALLVGHHDFTSFRAAMCQSASPVKTLRELRVEHDGADIVIHAEARSFLHHQVRNMTGTLVQIGLGRWPVTAIPAILAARSRAAAGQTAPPEGLFLTEVSYAPVAADGSPLP